MSTTMRFNITDGPSARSLVDAFFYAHGNQGTGRLCAKFKLKFEPTDRDEDVTASDLEPFKTTASIQSISHEDGSGTSFCIEGYIKNAEVPNDKQHRFTGYYNAKTRTGFIDVPDIE